MIWRHRAGVALALGGLLVLVAAPRPSVAVEGPTPERAGQLISTSPAGETSQVSGAASSVVISFSTSTSTGQVVPATGLVLVPAGEAPPNGWPLVVYGHMTTGIADRCAPTNGTPQHSELRRMQQGDDLARSLLAAGVAVARPDYEGLGAPGGHPYLRGRSLGRSMIDMASATRQLIPLDGRWVASGHSEGAVAALNVADTGQTLVGGMRLRGVHAITPVTQMDVLIRLLRPLPIAIEQVTGPLVALAALIIKGQAVEDPEFEHLALNGGLSSEAQAHWGHLEERCLNELSRADSWGGLAPSALLGPRGEELMGAAIAKLNEDDVRHLQLRDLPVRIEEGVIDEVAPFVLTERLVQTYRAQGLQVEHGRWLAGHSATNSDMFSVPAATTWILAQLNSTDPS